MKKLLLIPILAIIVSCNSKKEVASEKSIANPVEFEVLSESAYQGRESETFLIIKDNANLKALYQSVNIEDTPSIDFANERVVALFLGQRGNGGYAIKVKNVSEKSDKVYIDVEKTSPKPGENATMAITNPYCIVKIKTNKEIVINN